MFHSSPVSVRTYATRRPSDDTATACPPANVRTASMSSAVNKGVDCANAAGADAAVRNVVKATIDRCMASSTSEQSSRDVSAAAHDVTERRRKASELYTTPHARVRG